MRYSINPPVEPGTKLLIHPATGPGDPNAESRANGRVPSAPHFDQSVADESGAYCEVAPRADRNGVARSYQGHTVQRRPERGSDPDVLWCDLVPDPA